jgi:hypothetical protein
LPFFHVTNTNAIYNMKSIKTGAAHFSSVANMHRQSNYTLDKVINEIVDNVIKKASKIHIQTRVNDAILQELKVSDNYVGGFENINEDGTRNPFNMGHMRSGHDNDNETSEYGVGLKAGALSSGNVLTVYTRVGSPLGSNERSGGEKMCKIICDFQRMIEEDDVNESYNPKIREITLEEYKEVHEYEFGSTIVISQIRQAICGSCQENDANMTQAIKKGIAATYSRLIGINNGIYVNGELVEREYDFFADPKCIPFTVVKRMFVLKKPGDINEVFLVEKKIERSVWQMYDKVKDEWIGLDKGEDRLSCYLREGYELVYNQDKTNALKETIRIETTFSFYSENEENIPMDCVLIYKDNRLYGKKNFVKNNNGTNNYTIHKIEFTSKKIGKMLGITYNKEITMDVNNDLTKSLKSSIAENRREFNADASTSKNKELCDKAIKKNVINWRTCNIGLLSIKKWREERVKYDESLKPKPGSVVLEKPKPPEENPKDDIPEEKPKDDIPEEKPKDDIPEEKPKDDITEEKPKDDISEEKPKDDIPEEKPKDDITEEKPKDDIPEEKPKTIIVDDIPEEKPKTIIVDKKTNKMILTEISKYIMEKIAENESCDISMESCVMLFEIVKQQLV